MLKLRTVEYLHVFISKIRKKIELDPGKPRYVVTEARIGYSFWPSPKK
jgi:DNA-binding response OmpR family regulator